MISLLINSQISASDVSCETRFGGRPSVPESSFAWPTCTACQGNMQFLGQLRVQNLDSNDSLLLLFMCQNDPGSCDEWDPNAGGNRVIHVPCQSLKLAEPPEGGDVVRATLYGASTVHVDSDDYDEAREKWASSSGESPRQVLGQVGEHPAWVQGEEVPYCDSCALPMSFVAQLEEGPDWKTAMNFGGGGCAYVYQCDCETHQAKMLWQC